MNRAVKLLLILGLFLTIVPLLIGTAVTVISMIFAFHDLSQQGIADPHQLAGHIGSSLTATMIGLLCMPFGVAMLIAAGIVYAVTKPQKPRQTLS